MDNREIEEANVQMGWKWVTIPYSIIVLLWSGASYNLHDRWELVEQRYVQTSHNYTQIIVFWGCYFGIASGLIIHNLDVMYAYAIAALLALFGFAGLAMAVEYNDGSMAHLLITLMFLFISAFSGSIATFAAVVTSVQNFTRVSSLLVIVIMINYQKISPLLEDVIRSTYQSKVSIQTYYSGLGVILFLTYSIGGIITKRVHMRELHEAMVLSIDKISLFIFITIEVALIAAIYYIRFILNQIELTIYAFVIAALVNFIAFFIAWTMVSSQVQKDDYSLAALQPERGTDLDLSQVINDSKFVWIFISTLTIVGSSTAMYLNLWRVLTHDNKMSQLSEYSDMFWICEIFGTSLGGFITYALGQKLHETF